MRYVFQELTTEKFRIRVRESFPGVYLTLVSIIEGVALGILANETFKYLKDNQVFATEPYVAFWPYPLICFMTLIVVFYNYSWFVGVFRWSPKILDILLPFLLGFSQIGAILYITDTPNWWLWMAIFCLLGTFTFFNTWLNCKRIMFSPTKVGAYQRTQRTTLLNMSAAFIACLISISAYLLHRNCLVDYHLEVIFLFLLGASAIASIINVEIFLIDLHKKFGLSR